MPFYRKVFLNVLPPPPRNRPMKAISGLKLKGMSIDPTAPFKMYLVGFCAFKSPPVWNAFGRLRAFKSPYINACRVNSNTQNKILSYSLASYLMLAIESASIPVQLSASVITITRVPVPQRIMPHFFLPK